MRPRQYWALVYDTPFTHLFFELTTRRYSHYDEWEYSPAQRTRQNTARCRCRSETSGVNVIRDQERTGTLLYGAFDASEMRHFLYRAIAATGTRNNPLIARHVKCQNQSRFVLLCVWCDHDVDDSTRDQIIELMIPEYCTGRVEHQTSEETS